MTHATDSSGKVRFTVWDTRAAEIPYFSREKKRTPLPVATTLYTLLTYLIPTSSGLCSNTSSETSFEGLPERRRLLRWYNSVIHSVGIGYSDVNQPIVVRCLRFCNRHIRNQPINENWNDKPHGFSMGLLTYTDKSHFCEIGQHSDCGGYQCRCHKPIGKR